MPTMTSKQEALDPERLVVAWQGFEGPAGPVRAKDELRASDPLVRQAPANFVELGVPLSQRPAPIDQAIATEKERVAAVEAELAAEHLRQAHANRIRLAPAAYRSTHELIVIHDGRPALIEKGSIVHDGDPLLAEYPDAFKQT